MKSPYEVIHSRRFTEKSRTLSSLETSMSNRSVARCKSPKVVFNVHKKATKPEIARAVEEIYEGIKVVSVNTIITKPKKRRVRGHSGRTASHKKAVVTLRPGDKIEEKG